MSAVARRYVFTAQHHLPGVEYYDEPHYHDYTVEVVAEGPAGEDGMIVDTARLDGVWAQLVPDFEDSEDLNASLGILTTVENLSSYLLARFAPFGGTQVTVWEDDERWGRSP